MIFLYESFKCIFVRYHISGSNGAIAMNLRKKTYKNESQKKTQNNKQTKNKTKPKQIVKQN